MSRSVLFLTVFALAWFANHALFEPVAAHASTCPCSNESQTTSTDCGSIAAATVCLTIDLGSAELCTVAGRNWYCYEKIRRCYKWKCNQSGTPFQQCVPFSGVVLWEEFLQDCGSTFGDCVTGNSAIPGTQHYGDGVITGVCAS